MTLDFTKLTRRPDPTRLDCWQIYCDDVHVGTIAKAAGEGKSAVERWHWHAGFYAGTRPGQIKTGTERSFELAHGRFYRAWLDFAASRTPAELKFLRDHIEWTRRKYQTIDNGERVPIR
jgi:hypothetical protein